MNSLPIRHYRRQYVALTLLATAAFGLLGTAIEHYAPQHFTHTYATK